VALGYLLAGYIAATRRRPPERGARRVELMYRGANRPLEKVVRRLARREGAEVRIGRYPSGMTRLTVRGRRVVDEVLEIVGSRGVFRQLSGEAARFVALGYVLARKHVARLEPAGTRTRFVLSIGRGSVVVPASALRWAIARAEELGARVPRWLRSRASPARGIRLAIAVAYSVIARFLDEEDISVPFGTGCAPPRAVWYRERLRYPVRKLVEDGWLEELARELARRGLWPDARRALRLVVPREAWPEVEELVEEFGGWPDPETIARDEGWEPRSGEGGWARPFEELGEDEWRELMNEVGG